MSTFCVLDPSRRREVNKLQNVSNGTCTCNGNVKKRTNPSIDQVGLLTCGGMIDAPSKRNG